MRKIILINLIFYSLLFSSVLPEIELDPAVYPAPLVGYKPRIAYDPSNSRFFVVWVHRDPLVEVYGIYGAFLDENTFEVTKAFPIVTDIWCPSRTYVECDVVYDGEKFFVVYTNSDDIYGVFLSLEGVPLSEPFIVRQNVPQGSNFKNPDICFNGNSNNPVYLVTWSANYEITYMNQTVKRRLIAGIRLDKDGTKLDDYNRIISSVELFPNLHPSVASDGNNFVIIWVSGKTNILSRLMWSDGSIESSINEITNFYPSLDTLLGLNIAWGYDRYLVAYAYESPKYSGVRGSFLNTIGEPFKDFWILKSPRVYTSGITFKNNLFYVQMLASNFRYVIVGRIDLDGNLVGSIKPISYFDGFARLRSQIESGNTYLFSIWEAQPYTTLRGRIIDDELNIIYPQDVELLFSRGMNTQQIPDITFGDSLYLVVWNDNRKGGETGVGLERGVYGSFVNLKGELINPGFEIKDEVYILEVTPKVAFGGGKFLVIYQKIPDGELVGRFLLPSRIYPEFLIDKNGPLWFVYAYDNITISSGSSRFLIAYGYLGENVPGIKMILLDFDGNVIIDRLYIKPVNVNFGFSSIYGKIENNGYFLLKYPLTLGEEERIYGIDIIDENTGSILNSFSIFEVEAIDFKKDTFYVYNREQGMLYLRKIYPPTNYISSPIPLIELSTGDKYLKTSFDGWEHLFVYQTSENFLKYFTMFQDGQEMRLFSTPSVISTINRFNNRPQMKKGYLNQVFLTYETKVDDPMRVYGRFLEFFEVDDSLSLSFNSNTNLARAPLTDTIHVVFGRKDKIYYRKGFMLERTAVGYPRVLWDPVIEIGKGFNPLKGYIPSLTLDYDGSPHITWVRNDTVLYRRRENGTWSPEYIISYEPNVKKSMPVITVSKNHVIPERIHIFYADFYPEMIRNRIMEEYFPLNDPTQITSIPVVSSFGFPSVIFPSADFLGNLHLAYEVTTEVPGQIYYATRNLDQNTWQIHGNVFPYNLGKNSTTPMTETYGDSVYMVWTRFMEDGQYDVIRASHWIGAEEIEWNAGNFSRTPSSVSDPYYQAPVNSRGLYTVWVDVSGTGELDVFTRDPFDNNLLRNLTNSEGKAIFPEIFSLWRRRPATSLLGLVWLQEDAAQPQPLYNISSRIYSFIPLYYPAYYTLQAGRETPSIHLTYRDTFIDTWTYPVDIGYDSITARFYLDPGFEYEIVVQAYLERDEITYSHDEEEWEQEIYLDGRKKKKMELEFGELEEKKLFVPPGFYNDGILKVKIKRKKGDFAVIHRILVYRYDRTGDQEFKATGIQTRKDVSLITGPFIKTLIGNFLLIEFPEKLRERKPVYIYSISGRRISDFVLEPGKKTYRIGLKENTLPSGIYLLRMDKKVYRIIKLR